MLISATKTTLKMNLFSCFTKRNDLECEDFFALKKKFDTIQQDGNEEDILNTYCDNIQHQNVKEYLEDRFRLKDLISTQTNGLTIFDAISKEYLLSLKVFIKVLKINPNSKDSDGLTPLLLAARKGNSSAMKYLLEHSGCDVKIESPTHGAAHHIAAEGMHYDCLRLMIEHGCDINQCSPFLGTALSITMINGDERCANLLINSGCDINRTGPLSGSPLRFAVKFNNAHCVKLLLEAGCYKDPLFMNGTPLLTAVFNRNVDCIKLLLAAGCDKNGNGGDIPLFDALNDDSDDSSCLKLLIDAGCDLNAVNRLGHNALRMAAEYDSPKSFKLLLEAGATITISTEKKTMTPLYVAVYLQDPLLISTLLKAGCDKYQESRFLKTPLQIAASHGYLSCLKTLIERGGCDPERKRKSGWTTIFDALVWDRFECCKYLLEEQGCNVRHLNNDGESVLHVASKNGSVSCLRFLLDVCELKHFVNMKCSKGFTPLQMAAEKGHLEIVQILVDFGCDKQISSKTGKSALEIAEQEGHFDVATFLSGGIMVGGDEKQVSNRQKEVKQEEEEEEEEDFLFKKKNAFYHKVDVKEDRIVKETVADHADFVENVIDVSNADNVNDVSIVSTSVTDFQIKDSNYNIEEKIGIILDVQNNDKEDEEEDDEEENEEEIVTL